MLTEVTPAMSATGIVTRRSFCKKSDTLTNVEGVDRGEYFTLAPSGKSQSSRPL